MTVVLDITKLLGGSALKLQNMTPESFEIEGLFFQHGEKLYHKFDEMALFWMPDVESVVIAYYLAQKQVYWEKIPMARFEGEIHIQNIVGWQQVIPTAT